MAYEGPRSYRPVIMGRRGAVASNHPLATQAGLLALQAGGTAADAAIAVAARLSVVEPFMAGLGGPGAARRHAGAVRRRPAARRPPGGVRPGLGRGVGRAPRPLRAPAVAHPL